MKKGVIFVLLFWWSTPGFERNLVPVKMSVSSIQHQQTKKEKKNHIKSIWKIIDLLQNYIHND